MIGLLKSEDDEYELYSKSIVPKLRRISEKNRKAYLRLELEISKLILNCELELE
jgi:hypothetical protein